ncbi:DUF6292 family protein [Antrihabitans cavernicola]|uniref:DUF6292 domain-containing protein n=1 Tax=Antrihabitans cavernicola TaxID=2495913 RepID=A0A5A7S6I0_9NOCA|nr:DUF6292 family protein [Spelaeibacter cavernicola]KAA0019459.1 hypothetical protein FOY51_22710 [Spelaeibacter cavernicola]
MPPDSPHVGFDDDDSFRVYVESIAAAVGSGTEHCYCSPCKREAYVVVCTRSENAFPGREVALIWDADNGWGLAVETYSGEDMILLGRTDAEPMPTPDTVAALCADLLDAPH